MSIGLDNFDSSYVYRVLRPNEDPRSDLSCCAPHSIRTISQHVATGLKNPSRYISTTSSRDKALKWIDTANKNSSWRYGNKRNVIVKIDVGYLKTNHPEIAKSAYDLTKNLNRLNFLNSPKERSFSRAYNEVVFVDRIPKEAVSIEYMHGRGIVNHGDLSQRTTNPIKSTTNSLIPSSSPKIAKCKETYQQFLEHLAQLKIKISETKTVAPTLISSSDSSDTEDARYQLKSTTFGHSKYKPDITRRIPCSNHFGIKNSENITVKPRPILINSSIKSPEKHASYTHNYSRAKMPSQVGENNPLRTLPDYSINLSLDNDSYSDSSEDEAKRAFVSEIARERPKWRKSQVATAKTNRFDPNDVTRVEIRPSSGSNIQDKVEISDNIPVRRTIPSYKHIPYPRSLWSENKAENGQLTEPKQVNKPIPYPRSLYSKSKAENSQLPEPKQVNIPMSETYSVNRKMTEISKFKSIPPPDIAKPFSVSKVKIPVVTNVEQTAKEKQQLGNTTPNYSPYRCPQSHINSSSTEHQLRNKPKFPLPEVNAPAKSDFDTYLLRKASPTSEPSAYTNSVRIAPDDKVINQFRGRIAGNSEYQTFQLSMAYPSHKYTQI